MKDFIYSFFIYLVIIVSLNAFLTIEEWYSWLNLGGVWLLITIIDIALESEGLIANDKKP